MKAKQRFPSQIKTEYLLTNTKINTSNTIKMMPERSTEIKGEMNITEKDKYVAQSK